MRLLLDGAGRRLACMSHLPLYAGFTYFDKPHADEVHQAISRLSAYASPTSSSPRRGSPSGCWRQRTRSTPTASSSSAKGCGCTAGSGTEPPRTAIRCASSASRASSSRRACTSPSRCWLPCGGQGVPFTFTLVGRGPLESRVRSLLDRHGLQDRATLIREVDHDALLDLYTHSDVFLTTSLYETFGLTVLEAMSRGCVPVAFRLPALRELIGDAGITVPVGDVEAAADATAALADALGLRANLAALGRLRAADFTWERHADALMRVLELRA